jgi:uncharacterized protein YceK
MKRLLLATILCAAILTGCGNIVTEQDSIEQTETVTALSETTAADAKTEAATNETATPEQDETKYYDVDVSDAYDWLVSDVCNKGLREIDSALKSNDESFDMDFCIANLKIYYGKKEHFDKIIHALDDSIPEQAQLILAWDKSLEQADSLVDVAESGTMNADNFNLDLFDQYSHQFVESFSDICGPAVPLQTSPQNFVFAQAE